ncbi:hypothetical protein HW555_001935 [Spodoptera exigua]|uniref:Elongation of very long chain fatty acids protein n=1 Tax=Spodoptera exigua TaxID=7107 RepID=A0A835LAP2_SPOEX|nr:hypothetical protein HW555_001935 [Spodoptera exigua]
MKQERVTSSGICNHFYFFCIFIFFSPDQRVKDWALMTSPKPLAAIIVTYLVTIKLILPAYMRNRRPYELRSLIKWYNVLQIISNAVVTWGIMTSGWTTTYHFGCMLPDYSMNPEALRMLRFLWWTIMLKLLELFETAFFILRKKDRQASFLHVYHHVSTLIIVWSALKYVGGKYIYFKIILYIHYLVKLSLTFQI